MMEMIHGFMAAEDLIPFREFGTQEYEGDIVQLEKIGERHLSSQHEDSHWMGWVTDLAK